MHTCWIKGVLALIAIIFAWINFAWAPIVITLAVILMYITNDKCEECSMKRAKTSAPRKVVKATRKKTTKRRRRR
ncbi:hypothetical protein J4426_01680 [Candidatus Woesearchaeota archaeon]|nr:hypothetical protein [Candidatus Woesearchaeota archaeon]